MSYNSRISPALVAFWRILRVFIKNIFPGIVFFRSFKTMLNLTSYSWWGMSPESICAATSSNWLSSIVMVAEFSWLFYVVFYRVLLLASVSLEAANFFTLREIVSVRQQ